jgi:hypothetical protein
VLAAVRLGVFGAALFVPTVAWATPPSADDGSSATDDAAPSASAPSEAPSEAPTGDAPPVQRPTPAEPPVSDAAWKAVEGRQIVVETGSGPVEGELTSSAGDTLVLIGSDGQVLSVPKRDATGVRVADPKPAPAQPQPATPPDDAADEMAGLQTAPSEGGDTADKGDAEATDPDDPKARRKEKRKKRGFAILGAFTAQGATYTHWRGEGIKAGHASYAMDFGVGANLTQGFGMYVVGGGLLGTRLKTDDGRVNANYGRVAFLFLLGGKYYFSTLGAGVAFSRLKWKEPVPWDSLQKDVGLAIPFKIMGKIPLPENLYIGIGLTYEFATVRKFNRFINGIGGQIVFGRW